MGRVTVSEVLRLRGIVKRFPGVVANDGVDLTLEEGEIHAILGENGAGKSTLMKIVSGLLRPDEGSIALFGEPVRFSNPGEAIARGIGMVYQHFMLIPVFTVAENIVLGREPTRGPWFDRKQAEAEIRALSERFHLGIDPAARVADLGVGMQQRVEILKTFYRQARILILDEPTAALTPQEALDLFDIMRGLKEQGISILFISHKLDEVMTVADRITVMRGGRSVATLTPAATSAQELANLMVGRSVRLSSERPAQEQGENVLRVEDLHVLGTHGTEAVHGVSFTIRRGEIFGIAGVEGNGQQELVEALAGLRPPNQGSIALNGEEITAWSVARRSLRGVSYIPEDRQGVGLVLPFTLAENLILKRSSRPPYARWGLLQPGSIQREATAVLREFDVRPPAPDMLAKNLSGGNQQKVVLAREIHDGPELLLAAQPTRGLDIGAIEFVHERLLALRAQGKAILLVSLELDEVLELSDTVGVMYGGRLTVVLPAEQATRERVGQYMLGAQATEAAEVMRP